MVRNISRNSLTTGIKIVGSSGSPMPTVIYTNADTAAEFMVAEKMRSNTSFMYINKNTITFAFKEAPAALSQNRKVKITQG